MIRTINSLTNPTVKFVRALHMKKTREESGQFLVEGLKIILDALDCGHVPKMVFFGPKESTSPLLERVISKSLETNGDVFQVTSEILEKISRKENPQSVLGVFDQMPKSLSQIDPSLHELWIGLEQIRDPGNLGTIIRTADAIGAGGVILIDECVDAFGFEAVRASMGSIFSVPIIKTSLLDLTQDKRFTGSIIATHLKAHHSHRSAPYRAPCLLLMGTEQSGLTEALALMADLRVRIPMQGLADSLNLSIATAIIGYEAAHQLHGFSLKK